MSEEFTMEALETAARKWVEASEAVRRSREEVFTSSWPESGEAPPPEPKPVTREALAELDKRRLAEQKAHEEFDRISRGLLGLS